MNCPGSVALIKNLNLPQSDEPDYRREGTAAHEALEECMRNDIDAWEVVGKEFNGVTITADIADAIQVFIDTVREQRLRGIVKASGDATSIPKLVSLAIQQSLPSLRRQFILPEKAA